jgi:hypothetical protein
LILAVVAAIVVVQVVAKVTGAAQKGNAKEDNASIAAIAADA